MEVKFSEDDYRIRETAGSLTPIVTVVGNQVNGDIEFRVDALTRQQLTDQGIVCVDEDQPNFFDLLPTDVAEAECE